MGDTGEAIVDWIYTVMKWLSIIYLVAAAVIEFAATKIDPRKQRAA